MPLADIIPRNSTDQRNSGRLDDYGARLEHEEPRREPASATEDDIIPRCMTPRGESECDEQLGIRGGKCSAGNAEDIVDEESRYGLEGLEDDKGYGASG
jgi:hypothetical protein